MKKLRVLDLFSGIGGFSLGLERTGGFETAAFCEIEKHPRGVLAKHWPEVPCYNDVKKLTAARLASDGIKNIHTITGGFPCQDISTAGLQKGINPTTRSGLWSEIVRLVGDLRPEYIILENVSNLLAGPANKRGGWFGRVLGDLAGIGYDAEWENIPASSLGAPHRRERVWIVAYPTSDRLQSILDPKKLCREANPKGNTRQFTSMGSAEIWLGDMPLGSRPMVLGNGIPGEVGEIKCYGNSILPQIPEMIGYAILEAERQSELA